MIREIERGVSVGLIDLLRTNRYNLKIYKKSRI
jgi:hypothetical protein